MANVRSLGRSWLRKAAGWRWPGARPTDFPSQLAAPPEPGSELIVVADERWYLCVPYAAPGLMLTDPLVEMVSGYEIRIRQTDAERRFGSVVVEGLATVEEGLKVFAAINLPYSTVMA